MTNGAEPTLNRKARGKGPTIFIGLLVLVSGFPPFVNAMGNPRVATLHGSDVLGLFASGLCVGFGSALLITTLAFRDK